MQHRNNLSLVLHSLLPDVSSDVLRPNTPNTQKLAVRLWNVLVKDLHRTRSRANLLACATRALPAKWTASAIASLGTAPRHSAIISSQARPAATCSSTVLTRILVPRNV